MRAQEFVIETDEPTRIKLGSSDSAARAWIDRVYQLYPQTFQNNHVMPLGGSGDDQEFAMFELVPSLSRRGAVEVKWFQAYPLRQGVGSRAMQQLQQLAREDGISLTLFPWDKGQVSQSKLTKFYRGQGFSPIARGGKGMAWTPEHSGVSESWGVSKEPIPLPIGDYLAGGSDEFAPPGNYRSAEDLHDEVYDQIDAGVEPQVITVDPRTLLATQDWLSNAGGDDPLFDEYPDRPVVYQKAGKLYILDGHHRSTRAWRASRPIAVYLFSDKNLSENFADQKLQEDIFIDRFNEIDQIVTQTHGKLIYQLLLQMFPQGREIIDLQYNDEDGRPFSEWRRIIFEIDQWTLAGPVSVGSDRLLLDPEDYQIRMQKYNQYIADKEAGRPARYFRNNDADPREINFSKLPPVTLVKTNQGLEVADGMHRAVLAKLVGAPLRAYVWQKGTNQHPNVAKIKSLFKNIQENFADGKNPGRKGLSKRVGIPKKATLSQLQKIASSSTGERRRMAQWQLNMRRGKAKKNK
jgi:hypothetical protein